MYGIQGVSGGIVNTRWFKYDRDYLCVNLATSVPVIYEPTCILGSGIMGYSELISSYKHMCPIFNGCGDRAV